MAPSLSGENDAATIFEGPYLDINVLEGLTMSAA